MLLSRASGFIKAGEESIIPTSPSDLAEREIKNEHPHGRFSRLRKLWGKITGKDPLGLSKEARLSPCKRCGNTTRDQRLGICEKCAFPHGWQKEAFSRLDSGRKLLKRGLLSSMHLNDLKDLNARAVRVPQIMQIQSGKGPIVSRASSWRKMTERGGRFDQASEALRQQVVNHVPMAQPTGARVVTFKDKPRR